jgi:hypothetical protein
MRNGTSRLIASSIAHRTALAAACEPSTPTITADADLYIIFDS